MTIDFGKFQRNLDLLQKDAVLGIWVRSVGVAQESACKPAGMPIGSWPNTMKVTRDKRQFVSSHLFYEM